MLNSSLLVLLDSSPIIEISVFQVTAYFTGNIFVHGAALMIDLKRC